MSWHDSSDNDFDIRINHDYDYQRPRKIGTFLRNSKLALFLVINIISISTMIFFLSGGHPIDRVINLKQSNSSIVKPAGTANRSEKVSNKIKSPWELYNEDEKRVKAVISTILGENVHFTLAPYELFEVDYMKRTYSVLRNSGGNLFTSIGGEYHYLSKDGKRLYRCLVPDNKVNKTANVSGRQNRREPETPTEKPTIIYSPSSVSGEPLNPGDQFYKDENGVWRNY